MDEKKDIGKAFEERLSDNKVTPNNIVWKNIVAELDKKKKKKKKKPFIIWWKIGGIAAGILILISIGSKLISNKNQNIITITNDDTQNSKSKSTHYKVTDSAKLIVDKKTDLIKNSSISKMEQNTQEETSSTTHHLLINNNSKVKTNQLIVNNSMFKLQKNNSNYDNTAKNSVAKIVIESENKITTTNQNEQQIIKNELLKKMNISALDSTKLNSNTIVNKHKKGDLNIQITKANDESILINNDEKTNNKWQISLKVAPIYYNSLSNGSSLGSNTNTNSENDEITLSYGLSASYTINQKFKIRTGFNKVNLANKTNNIDTNTILNSQTISINNISYFEDTQNQTIFPGENIININQEISYLEIPIELKYTLFNKKVGIDLISGFSTLILADNNIFTNNINLGSTTNLKKISFTGNLGLGLNYKLNKKINFNLEPLLKIQLNPYNSETDYKPYFFGVYSGFSYQFK